MLGEINGPLCSFMKLLCGLHGISVLPAQFSSASVVLKRQPIATSGPWEVGDVHMLLPDTSVMYTLMYII
ncbi:hypothetical protein GGI1_13027 [Acidithiobacillus sp. GGI-221]|uniref:Uncharacterized protein n=1 Tax=Acidithiobacillus ferrooxidans TaxID=920 RepID=A0A2W1K1C3_ACIFR|nr:hypothetical protein GGI1_13027 [Acidithiobacillus sp. GGI-221]PZD80436.1 hypothetical protein DN052_13165 [Acidithiobacillus ferrooxidans]